MLPADQFVRFGRFAARLQIFRRRHQHPFAFHDAPHPQAGILDDAEPEGDVDAFLHDVDIVVGEPEPHLDIRVFVVEIGDAGGHQPAPEAEWRRHLYGAARLA